MIGLLDRDIHSHILPGVDDGFRHASDSLKALQLLSQQGCKEICFTPHLNPDVYPDSNEAVLRARYDTFINDIPDSFGLTTHLAAEYMIVKDFESRVRNSEALLCYPDKSILVEMSYFYSSPNLETALFELSVAGYKPILAHPERYTYLSGKLDRFERLKDMGCRFQMNYMSIGEVYGPDSVKILKHLLANGWYDFVSTDLHSVHQLDSILNIRPSRSIAKLLERSFPQLEIKSTRLGFLWF